MRVRKSKGNNRLVETNCSHDWGEEGSPPRERALMASEAEGHQALFVCPLPKREYLMSAHTWPTSAWIEKKHMESITEASTCGLEKSALSPHHPLLPTISEFLFFRSKIWSNSIYRNSSLMFTCILYLRNQIPHRDLSYKKVKERATKETSNETNHYKRENYIKLLNVCSKTLKFSLGLAFRENTSSCPPPS